MSDIREKIKNLFDLASSDNENEAKAALLKAQELMVKHKLSEKDLDMAKKQSVKNISTGLTYSKQRDSFILSLTNVLTENYCCVHYAERGYGKKTRTMMIAGLEDDVDICMQVLQKAVQTINANSKKLVFRKGYSSAQKKIVMDSYAKGFVKGLDEMYRAQRKTNEDEWGLVLVTTEEVKNIISDMSKSNFSVRNKGFSHSAYDKGQQDGASFNPGKTHGIGNSTLAICG